MSANNQYEGQLFKIATHEGDKYVPGITIDDCPGLAVTLSGVARFTITHIRSGTSLCKGNYERCDNAILDMTRFAAIAKAYGFSWKDEKPQDCIKNIKNMPVPFSGATISGKDGETPITIQRFIERLRPCIPFRDIDTPPWEEIHPIDQADHLLIEMENQTP